MRKPKSRTITYFEPLLAKFLELQACVFGHGNIHEYFSGYLKAVQKFTKIVRIVSEKLEKKIKKITYFRPILDHFLPMFPDLHPYYFAKTNTCSALFGCIRAVQKLRQNL